MKMRRLVVALILAGCAATTVSIKGVPIDETLVGKIKPGITTREAILKEFGPPSEITAEEGREKLVYRHREAKTRSYLGGLVEMKGRSELKEAVLTVTIKGNIVESYRFETTGPEEE
jgi:hypothetical protein